MYVHYLHSSTELCQKDKVKYYSSHLFSPNISGIMKTSIEGRLYFTKTINIKFR